MSEEMSLIDEIYDRMNDDTEAIHRTVHLGDSEVQKFYAGKTLFITGVTGFMGKCLMEKLLRSCPDIKHIYVLMRIKKSESLEERMKKYFQNEIFEVLRRVNPYFEKKVTALQGDLFLDKMGMSDEDQDIIKKETNIIIHNAANVKFNTRANILLKTNVIGTKLILDLAEQCDNLELFLYVSSAYSHNYKLKIEEKFYNAPADLSTVYDMIDADANTKNGLTEEAVKMLTGDCLNCYTFTKAMAEELVRQRAEKVNFPCGVYRPSIVVSTYNEPLKGWMGNANGPVWLILLFGLGITHTAVFYGHPMDMVPCDMAINALIAITKDIPDRCASKKEAVIYNYGSSVLNPTELRGLYQYVKNEGARNRSSNAVWLNSVYITGSFTTFLIAHFILHFIPACFIDLVLLLMGRKPKLVPLFYKITSNLSILIAVTNTNWRIHMPETLKVIERLNPSDQELFFSDPRKINWGEWFWTMWNGLRLYVLKENLQSKAGERRYVLLWWAHYGLVTVVILILTYLYLKMALSLFN